MLPCFPSISQGSPTATTAHNSAAKSPRRWNTLRRSIRPCPRCPLVLAARTTTDGRPLHRLRWQAVIFLTGSLDELENASGQSNAMNNATVTRGAIYQRTCSAINSSNTPTFAWLCSPLCLEPSSFLQLIAAPPLPPHLTADSATATIKTFTISMTPESADLGFPNSEKL